MRIGGVVGVCAEGQTPKPGIVLSIYIGPGETEPRLDVVCVAALASAGAPKAVAPCVFIGVPHESAKGSPFGLWWKHSGPEVLVRGPVGGAAHEG